MPCLEISMPQVPVGVKEELAAKLTDAFAEATPFPADIFGIRFNEYEPSQAASGGKLCNHPDQRPYLHMLLYCPRVNHTTRQQIVALFTDVFVDVMGKPDWQPVVHICEHPYDNVGVEGKLLSDAFPELAERKFYYDVSD